VNLFELLTGFIAALLVHSAVAKMIDKGDFAKALNSVGLPFICVSISELS
jgi:hypothetical protein